MKRWMYLLAASAVALAGAASGAEKGRPQRTLKDLEGRKIEIRKGEPAPASTEKAMEQYQAVLDLESADPLLRAQALKRLADLNLEASEVERAEREQVTAEGLQAAEAIRLYSLLLEKHPDFARADAVLYQLARAYDSNAQPEQALATLDRLVAQYPSSRLIDEAQFRRGELLFSAGRYTEAEAAYAGVQAAGIESTFYEQSLYKRGWALFKLSRNDESLEQFGQLLDRKLLDPADPRAVRDIAAMPRPEQELIEDSFRACSIMFSDLDGPRSAAEFVSSRGEPPYAWLVYARLGDLYVEKERYQDAAEAYEAFVQRHPVDANAPLLQVRAIEAYRKGGFASLVLNGKEEFVERYGLGTPFWEGREPAQYPQVVAELKGSVMELAQHYHAEAQKSKSQSHYGQAARWYRSYLDWFPEDPDSPQTNFLLAESLFESRQFEAAATEYERTAYGYGPHARAEEAGYAALLAYAEHEKTLSEPELAAWHARGLESGLMFAASWPEHKEVPVILTRSARELFDLKDFDRAIEVAERVLTLQPAVDADKRRIALTVIAHARFDQERFADAEVAYQQLLAAIRPNDPERAALSEKLAAAVYKQAEEKQAAGDAAGAVDAFLRVSRVAPGASVARNAEYDAAAALVNMKDWPRAIEVLERFRRTFPDDPLTNEATRTLAVAYTETSQPALAAVEFERIADMPPEDAMEEERREALWQAAQLYEKAGNTGASTRAYERFVQRHATDFTRSMEARQRLADAAARDNDFRTRDRWLQEIIRTHDAAAEPTDRSRYLAARASLTLAEPLGAAFSAIELRAPLNKSLARKREAMEQALKAYGRAAEYAVAEVTTAATYSMAELYRTLAQHLMESERPKNLAEDELEQYDILLEEQAFPFEEKAIEIHAANTARTRDGIYNEWVRRSFEVLARLQPARYGKVEPGAGELPDDSEHLQAEATVLEEQVKQQMQEVEQGAAQAAAEEQAPQPPTAGAEAEATPRPDPAVLTRLGLVYRKLGRFDDARAAYEQALASDPDHTPAWLNLGVLYDLYLQEPERALEAFETYQQLSGALSENGDTGVANWIAELKRRLGSNQTPAGEEVSAT